MLSIAPTGYHSISPTAYIFPPPQPSWRLTRLSLMVSLSPSLPFSMRINEVLPHGMSNCLTEDTKTHRLYWTDARGQALTPCRRSINAMVVEVSVRAGFTVRMCLMTGDRWFSPVTFTVQRWSRAVKGHRRLGSSSCSTRIVWMCANKGHYWPKHNETLCKLFVDTGL